MKYLFFLIFLSACSTNKKSDIIKYNFIKNLLEKGPKISKTTLTENDYKNINSDYETEDYVYFQYKKEDNEDIIEVGSSPWNNNIIVITKDKKLIDSLIASALLDGFELKDDFTKLGINSKTYKKNDLKCGFSEAEGLYKFSMEKKGLYK